MEKEEYRLRVSVLGGKPLVEPKINDHGQGEIMNQSKSTNMHFLSFTFELSVFSGAEAV